MTTRPRTTRAGACTTYRLKLAGGLAMQTREAVAMQAREAVAM